MELLTYDIETNSIDFKLPNPAVSATVIHCIVVTDDDGVATRYNGMPGCLSVEEGIARLITAPNIGGHNVIAFDNRVLDHLYGFKPQGNVWDSLLLSEMHYGSDLRWRDAAARKAGRIEMTGNLVGRHSLEAWGARLGEVKDDYTKRCRAGEYGGTLKDDPFAHWHLPMEDYCVQDVNVNRLLFGLLRKRGVLAMPAARMECDLAPFLNAITTRGWYFDVDAAQKLVAVLSGRRDDVGQRLKVAFGNFYQPDGPLFTPKRDNAKMGYTKGVPVQKVKRVEFNPGSDMHVARMLTKRYGWKPTTFTDSGLPSITETVLKGMSYPEVPDLMEFAIVNKRLSMIYEGDKAWLRFVKDGRIHGQFFQNGTRTGRMSHANPNVAQVVASRSAYGPECRRLWTATPGWTMVGADASGIEMRMLAHFCHRYDNGALANVLLSGDVHSENQNAIGLNSRDSAKTFQYAMLYGAGMEKLGWIVFLDMTPDQRKEFGKPNKTKLQTIGSAAHAAVMARFPAISELVTRLQKQAKAGQLVGIDGRILTGVSRHNALNTYLQGCAGVLIKAAVLRIPKELAKVDYVLGDQVFLIGHIHDELQSECNNTADPELVGSALVSAIRQTGEDYGLTIPLDGEHKCGPTWHDTH